jgi:hypothetical protein
MEGLDKGGQGPTSGCCAIEEEDYVILNHVIGLFSLKYNSGFGGFSYY